MFVNKHDMLLIATLRTYHIILPYGKISFDEIKYHCEYNEQYHKKFTSKASNIIFASKNIIMSNSE